MATGEISAHPAGVYGAEVSRHTICMITGKVMGRIDLMSDRRRAGTTWRSWPSPPTPKQCASISLTSRLSSEDDYTRGRGCSPGPACYAETPGRVMKPTIVNSLRVRVSGPGYHMPGTGEGATETLMMNSRS
jgi:hypothetical protein